MVLTNLLSTLTVSSWCLCTLVSSEPINNNDKKSLYPNSCSSLEDGTHLLKLLDGDEYPVVEVTCSNGYIILDVTKDSKLESYFSSFEMWHTYIAGPSNNDPTTWKNWYLPSKYSDDDIDTKFLVTESCDVCDEKDDSLNELGTDTTTWMTGNVFGCYWLLKGIHTCDMDDDTYDCYYCNTKFVQTEMTSYIASNWVGTCMKLLRNSDDEVATSHDTCTAYHSYSYKPTLMTNGKSCVCAKTGDKTEYFLGDAPETEEEEENPAEVINDNNYDSKEGIYKLHQSDFMSGTYRIVKPGKYVIMEDIIFDFNAPNEDDDEEVDGYNYKAYWPNEDQRDLYNGAGIETGTSWRDEYFMGFFAGIAIECDDVEIDLNGKTLQQSYEFYIQQRFFSIIELSNQPFAPGQGIGMFGNNPVRISNIKIYNGVLGLSSHHGIHGNKVTNVEITDLIIENWETHGIQINGFNNLLIKDVEIKDSSKVSYLKSHYFHARLLLPRLQYVLNENEENDEESRNYVQFRSRTEPVYLGDLITTIENELDMVYKWLTDYDNFQIELETVISKHEGQYSQWLEAKELFINENGIPYGSTLYGLFLNAQGANVFTISQSQVDDIPGISDGLILDNVKIHDLQHNLEETVRFHRQQTFLVNPFNAVIEVRNLFSNTDDFTKSEYTGNTLTDAYFALNSMTTNWGILGMQHFSDASPENSGLVGWVMGNNDISNDRSSFGIGCNCDSMTHNSKGIFGARIEGVTNVQISNLQIYNLHDNTPLGEDSLCGEYDGFSQGNGGHFSQKVPTQVGFTGNSVQALHLTSIEITKFENIEINNIVSDYGLSYGIAVWHTASLDITGKINMKNIRAGVELEKNSLTYDDLPNKAPEACGVRVFWEYDDIVPEINIDKNVDINTDINTECVYGHVSCFNYAGYSGTTLGTYTTTQENNNKCSLKNDYENEFIIYNNKEHSDAGISLEESQTLFTLTSSYDGTALLTALNKHNSNDENKKEMNKGNVSIKSQNKKSNINDGLILIAVFSVLCALFGYIIYSKKCSVIETNNNKLSKDSKVLKGENNDEQSQLLTSYGTI